jgi:hypothetical protein
MHVLERRIWATKPTGERKRGLASKKEVVCIWLESFCFSEMFVSMVCHINVCSVVWLVRWRRISVVWLCAQCTCTEEATCTTQATRGLSILFIYLLLGIYAVPKWCTGIVPEVIKYTTCYLWLSYKQGFGIRFGKKIRSQPNWTNFGKIRMNFGLNSVKFRNVKHKIRFGPHRNGRISPKFGLIQSNPRTLLTSTINSYVDVARPN